MNPDFTKIPYGFAEFPKATLDAWNAAAGPTAPWTAPEGFAHRAVHTAADAHLPHAGGLPGIAPFLGGPYATMFGDGHQDSVNDCTNTVPAAVPSDVHRASG